MSVSLTPPFKITIPEKSNAIPLEDINTQLRAEEVNEIGEAINKNALFCGAGYADLSALQTAVPSPAIGSYAYLSSGVKYRCISLGVWSVEPTGTGDMTKAVYDPTSVNGDAFDMDNMVEGSTNKILTQAERDAIAAFNIDPSDVVLKDGSVGMTGTLKLAPPDVITAAATLDMSALQSNFVIVTGTGTISGMTGAQQYGEFYLISFASGLTLEHSGSFSLPDQANIVTGNGDKALFYWAGAWTCWAYWTEGGSSFGNQPLEVANTGGSLGLRHTRGVLCNELAPNANTVYEYEHFHIHGAWEHIRINATSEPYVRSAFTRPATLLQSGDIVEIAVVGTTDFTAIGAPDNNVGTQFTATGAGTGTGTVKTLATKIKGSAFQASTDMYLIVRNMDGAIPQYYFEEIAP